MRTVGTVRYDRTGRCWTVECEAHVSVRLKRVFAKIATNSFGRHRLSDTPENARELAWFLVRYPMVVEDESLLTYRAKEHEDRTSLVEAMMAGRIAPPSFDLAIPPRPYQALAASILLRGGSLLLADDLGLGKTCSAIATFTDPRTLPVLVVTLTHLPKQWAAEIQRFAPKLRTHIVNSGKPYDITAADARKRFGRRGTKSGQRELPGAFPDVVILNYHKLAGWTETLSPIVRSVVFDEAQELRKSDSNKYSAASHIARSVSFRMALTGTPIYNYGGEIFNVLDVVQPDSLGKRDEFEREWCTGFRDKVSIKDPKAFGIYVRDAGLMLRRTRADVGRELPALTKAPHMVDADESALESVGASCAELARTILRQGGSAKGEKMQAAEEFSNRLRQATGIAKAPFVASFVRMLIENGEKLVLFGWHREVYSIWMDRLADLKPAMYTGSESPFQKEEARRRFVDGETQILIMSLRSGAGLDGLQSACRTVVFGELDWSPGVHEQCLSFDTEILTPSGFRGCDELQVGDEVAAFDIDTNEIRWMPAVRKTDRSLALGERIIAAATKKIDVRVTGEHRMVVRRKTRTANGVGRSRWVLEEAQHVVGEARRFVPTAGIQKAHGVPLSDHELRLIGWFLSDGHFNGRFLTIFQAASQPWNHDLVEVLDGCGLGWSKYCRKNARGGVMNLYVVQKGVLSRWTKSEIALLRAMMADGATPAQISTALKRSIVGVQHKIRRVVRGQIREAPTLPVGPGWERLGPYLDKDVSPLLEGMTRDQLKSLLRGLFMGDGTKSTRLKNVMRITNTNKRMLDRIQSLCVRRGMSANISQRSSLTKAGKKVFDIWISDAIEASLPQTSRANTLAPMPVQFGERVWCVSNELGTLVTRRNGKVAIVGNCTGRVYRDGQQEPVVAYYLIAETGADPVIVDVLGVKKSQVDGIKDPNASLVETSVSDVDRVKKLAAAWLEQRGEMTSERTVAA